MRAIEPLTQTAEPLRPHEVDLDTLLITMAHVLDMRYEFIYGYLRDDMTHKYPSVDRATSS